MFIHMFIRLHASIYVHEYMYSYTCIYMYMHQLIQYKPQIYYIREGCLIPLQVQELVRVSTKLQNTKNGMESLSQNHENENLFCDSERVSPFCANADKFQE
jgi:hypothetical protein